ncbi:MAG: [protein-PII] uridylyltransferase [Nocardioides sp.]
MTAAERLIRSQAADALCFSAYGDGPTTGVALVAVGGFGRQEMAPFSDLDVVLVHDDLVDPGEFARSIWYPLWDTGMKIDHSVRSLSQMTTGAAQDVRVATGLLDIRHLAGDPNLTLRLRAITAADWRRRARVMVPQLRDLVEQRHRRFGELAHVSVPDIKECAGGLRDGVTLNALQSTWLVDVPQVDLERSRQMLLDVRDHVQDLAGRASDRITPEMWPDLADRLELADALAAQTYVREIGRRITHLSRLSWRRAADYLQQRGPGRPRRPDLKKLEPGVAESNREIVLDDTVDPARDPLLLLRAAALASERDCLIAPATVARLSRNIAVIPDPWPESARQLFIRLLAGPGLLATWETLDETGALAAILPEWDRIRLLPHASIVHQFTVDRHSIETCRQASSLIRRVSRPDVLLVAALLHDLGKGGVGDHCVAGEPLARSVALRMGFDSASVPIIAMLVRRHLMLSAIAMTRDPDDPATIAAVTEHIGDEESLDLLLALSEADARATSPKVWSSWRAQLVSDLVRGVRASLVHGGPLPVVEPVPVDVPDLVYAGGTAVEAMAEADGGSRLTVVALDRVGLLADVAGALGLLRISVRGCRAWPQDEHVAVSVWEVDQDDVNPAVVRQRIEAVVEGRLDPSRAVRADPTALAPSVVVQPDASRASTVLEVRTADQAGVIHTVAAALAQTGITIKSAHIDTLGPQAVDVFYLQESGAGALTDQRAAEAAHAVRAALEGP